MDRKNKYYLYRVIIRIKKKIRLKIFIRYEDKKNEVEEN